MHPDSHEYLEHCDCENCSYQREKNPHKNEWILPNGAKVVRSGFKDSWMIVTHSGQPGKIYQDDILPLIEALQEIRGKHENKL